MKAPIYDFGCWVAVLGVGCVIWIIWAAVQVFKG